jgi:hypothetical protein
MPTFEGRGMKTDPIGAVRIAAAHARPSVAYTIGTLVNDRAQYDQGDRLKTDHFSSCGIPRP